MKLLYKIAAICAIPILSACSLDDEPDNTSNQWKDLNDSWIIEKSLEKDANGNDVYKKVTALWDPNAYVLMRWHNDPSETESSLSPISTSTVDVRYEVSTIDSVMVDSSHKRVSPAPGVYRSVLNKNITGWILGVSKMHIGDTCTILIPYNQAYGYMPYNGLKGYSNLIFNVRLVGIPKYEKP